MSRSSSPVRCRRPEVPLTENTLLCCRNRHRCLPATVQGRGIRYRFSGAALYRPDSRIETVLAGPPPECGEGAADCNATRISVATRIRRVGNRRVHNTVNSKILRSMDGHDRTHPLVISSAAIDAGFTLQSFDTFLRNDGNHDKTSHGFGPPQTEDRIEQ